MLKKSQNSPFVRRYQGGFWKFHLRKIDRFLGILLPDNPKPLKGRWWMLLGVIVGYLLRGVL